MDKDAIVNEIAAKLDAKLEIPLEKSPEVFALCPVGIIGSGKTTVVTPLAKRFSLVRISGDEVRELLHAAGYGYDYVHDIAALLVRNYLSLGYGIAIDSDCSSPTTQELIESLREEFNIPIIWIHINTPEPFILEALKKRDKSWLFKTYEAAVANYEERKVLHENLTMPFIYTFDVSRADFENQLEESVQKIQEKLRATNS